MTRKPPSEDRPGINDSMARLWSLVCLLTVLLLAGLSVHAQAQPTAPTVRFLQTAVLPGFSLPMTNAWSPTAPLLCLYGSRGFYVYDLRSAEPSPTLVVEGLATDHEWSPDGTWLLCRVKEPADMLRGTASLIATSPSGDQATLLAHADIGRFVWTSDGSITCWSRLSGSQQTLPPPAAWLAQATPHTARRPTLINRYDATLRQPVLSKLYQPPHSPETLRPSAPTAPPDYVLIKDIFPDSLRYLVVTSSPDWHTAVIDTNGRELTRLGAEFGTNRFSGTSVSYDGSFVVGYTPQLDEDEPLSDDAQLIFAVSSTGTWKARVEGAPRGDNPQLSKVDLHIAISADLGAVYVGTLSID